MVLPRHVSPITLHPLPADSDRIAKQGCILPQRPRSCDGISGTHCAVLFPLRKPDLELLRPPTCFGEIYDGHCTLFRKMPFICYHLRQDCQGRPGPERIHAIWSRFALRVVQLCCFDVAEGTLSVFVPRTSLISTVYLKLIRTEFKTFIENEKDILDLVSSVADLFEEIAVNPYHTPCAPSHPNQLPRSLLTLVWSYSVVQHIPSRISVNEDSANPTRITRAQRQPRHTYGQRRRTRIHGRPIPP